MALLSAALAGARDWGECALNLVFPWPESAEAEPERIEAPFCQQCGYPYADVPQSPFVCSGCMNQKWHFAWARAGYMTSGQVHESIVGFKYNDEYFRLTQLLGWLGETFDRFAGTEAWDALVPVPLYFRHHRDRGFNQAQELARGLGRRRGLPVWTCLTRTRETPSQTGLSRPARRENMNGAFAVKGRFDVTGRRLLLIDDVFTTGATANACARELARAGAARIAVLTVARS